MHTYSDKKGARHGPSHSQWKGGSSITSDGYVKINRNLVPEQYWSMACSSGWILQHRFIMAQYLGRPLSSNELVHHKDHDRKNNAIENLKITTKSEHMRTHKSWETMLAGKRTNKPFICNETNEIFLNLREASVKLQMSRDSIMRTMRGKVKNRKNYTFTHIAPEIF